MLKPQMGLSFVENNCMKFSFRRNVRPFEDSRKNLRAMGLIKGNVEEDVCFKGTGNYSNCNFCGVTLMCTTKVYVSLVLFPQFSYMFQDPFTGLLDQNFKTSSKKNPQFDIGGGVSSYKIIAFIYFIYYKSYFRTKKKVIGCGFVMLSIPVKQKKRR